MRLVWVAVVALVALSLAGCAQPAEPEIGDHVAPVVGMNRVYRVSGDEGPNTTATHRISGLTQLALGDATHAAYVVDDGKSLAWYRVSDGALLQRSPHDPAEGRTTFDEPCRLAVYPLHVQQRGNIACTGVHVADDVTIDIELTGTFRVPRMEALTVPAGTFQALYLDQDVTVRNPAGETLWRTRSFTWYNDEACGPVRIVDRDYEEGGVAVTTRDLMRFAC